MSEWANVPDLRYAVAALRAGGVIAYPTEAVWGLGCDPANQAAAEQILALKQRECGMGLILIGHSMDQFEPYLTGLSSDQLDTLRASWPGPVTWLVPDNGTAAEWITGGRDTLALRVTNHPVAAALCAAFDGPLVSTSANPHGLPPANNADEVSAYFGDKLSAIAHGETGSQASPTEIRNLKTGEIIRPG